METNVNQSNKNSNTPLINVTKTEMINAYICYYKWEICQNVLQKDNYSFDIGNREG